LNLSLAILAKERGRRLLVAIDFKAIIFQWRGGFIYLAVVLGLLLGKRRAMVFNFGREIELVGKIWLN
jgi:hypothetical protein